MANQAVATDTFVSILLWFERKPPARLATDAQETQAILVIGLAPSPPRELVVVEERELVGKRYLNREIDERECIVQQIRLERKNRLCRERFFLGFSCRFR